MKLQGQVALITGGGSGIGRATSLLFAKEGAKVVIADRHEAGGTAVKAEIEASGGEALFVRADVSRAEDAKNMVEQTVSTFGRLDILYNNAGLPQAFKLAEEIEEDFVDKILAVNVKGPFLGSKYAIPVMKRQGSGNILFTSSMTGVRPMPGTNLYATTKGAEVVLAKALAIELAPHKIRVNAICPVAVDSPMLPEFIAGEDKEEGKRQLLSKFPLGSLVTPEEVAEAALYLVSAEAKMITGTALQLDGGRGI